MKSRRGFAIQRLMNAMRQAHAEGWFIVFDTLTLADDRLEAFYDNPNSLRDYFRDIGLMVLAAEGRKAHDSHADCYQYFRVPEYGTANGRLHFHAVHVMRTLPTGSGGSNFGRRVRNRRQLNSLQNTWPYGYSMPIAVRYTQDAFSRSGWLWPVDAKGEPLRSEERFSRNAETDLVCRLLLEKKKEKKISATVRRLTITNHRITS